MTSNSNNKPVIIKIEFTKEQQDLIDKIKNREPIKRTRLSTNKERGYSYEYTINKPLSVLSGHKRLVELYGGVCSSGCGQWPDYKVMVDVGDVRGGAWLVSRYCQECFDKQKQPIADTYNKRHKIKESSKE